MTDTESLRAADRRLQAAQLAADADALAELSAVTFFDAPDGTRLAYHDDGAGEPLVCLPGGPMQASACRPQELNQEAAAIYCSAGAIDPAAVRSALADLPAPVLLIAGEYDPALPPERAAEYAQLFPHGRLVVQPGAGHFAWLDNAERFVRTVVDFLR